MDIFIGVMSGTSVDGIDAALVSFHKNQVRMMDNHSIDFPPKLKQELEELLQTFNVSLPKLGEIDHRLGLCYAQCVNELLVKAGVEAGNVKAIGCHGQTVFHEPFGDYPFTMQIGDGNILAAKTGIDTVADFRRMDMAFGGGGAPLTPAFHDCYFRSAHENRVILNLGGIANITVLDSEPVRGMDTGPANCLMDLWIQENKQQSYDCDGKWARSGVVNKMLLDKFLDDPYFALEPPKSTGKELFNLNWLRCKIKGFSISSEDIQATILEFTAKSVSDAVVKYAPEVHSLYVCGGGARNVFLLERIAALLPDIRIGITDQLGVPVQWVEAIAFAYLARCRVLGRSGNLLSVTGARGSAILGALYKGSQR